MPGTMFTTLARWSQRAGTRRWISAASVAGVLLLPSGAHAQTGENVLVVVNADSPASVEIGEYYAAKRAVPANQVIRLRTSLNETVSRADYERTIETPLGGWLVALSLQDRILYIVLTKGVPLRVAGTGGRDGTGASVDSELTLLYRKLLGHSPPVIGRFDNPTFLGAREPKAALPFTRFTADTYLVTRLDGFTVTDAKALVDRAMTPSTAGVVVLDQKATTLDRGGDSWLETAAARLNGTSTDRRAVLETSRTLAKESGPVIGYFSWGSNDPANQLRRFGFSFAPGAIGGMFVSTDGRTFVEPPVSWKPSQPSGGPVFRGSFQSLAADLIRDGLTGVAASIDEPFLDAIVRPDVLFPAYLSGFNLAESFYLATPYLSWQTVVIGDPLCRPFPGKTLSPEEIAKGIDPETELPGLYSERRLALASQGGLNQAAVKLLLKKDAQVGRGDRSNTEALLTEAAEMEPRLVAAHMQLAALFEERKDYARAIDRYRRIVSIDTENFSALNNLAYALAVHENKPQEALPHAERAYRLSKQAPAVADTVGWIHHLLKDDRTAIFFIGQALRGLPSHPDVLIHAATVFAGLNDLARARVLLATAEKLGATVTDRDDYKALRDRLKQP